METRQELVAQGHGGMDRVAEVLDNSSPAAEEVEEQYDLRTRVLVHLQKTDKNSDRDDASSVRSRDSLDFLGDDLERTSNMGGSQRDLHSLASPEDQVEPEPASEPPGVSLCAHPAGGEVTLADCQGDPPPPLHLVGEPPRLEGPPLNKDLDETVVERPSPTAEDPDEEGNADTTLKMSPLHSSDAALGDPQSQAQCAIAPGDQTADHMMSHDQHQASPGVQDMAVVEVGTPNGEGVDDPLPPLLPPVEEDVELQGVEGIAALGPVAGSIEASPHAVGETTALVIGIKVRYAEGKECVHRTYWPGRVVSPEEGIIELTSDGLLGQSIRYPPLFSRRYRKETMDEEMV